MDNQRDNFIPPFTPVQQPKPKKPVGLIVSVVLLVLVALGLGTGLYLQIVQAKDLQRQVDDLEAAAAKMDEQMAADMNMAQPAAEYREIPELGVKYKLTDETKDLTYAYDGSDGTDMAHFATLDLVKLKDSEGVYPCQQGVSGMIVRYDERPKVREGVTVKELADHFFVYTAPQSACEVDGEAPSGLTEAVSAVKAAFDSLEAM